MLRWRTAPSATARPRSSRATSSASASPRRTARRALHPGRSQRRELELLDGASSALSFAGVVVTNYDLTYAGPLVADFDLTLDPATVALRVYDVHDAGGDSGHSGFTTFSNLPAATRAIRVTSDSLGPQFTDGVHFYLATEVPEPAAPMLEVAAVAALAVRLRTRTTPAAR